MWYCAGPLRVRPPGPGADRVDVGEPRTVLDPAGMNLGARLDKAARLDEIAVLSDLNQSSVSGGVGAGLAGLDGFGARGDRAHNVLLVVG